MSYKPWRTRLYTTERRLSQKFAAPPGIARQQLPIASDRRTFGLLIGMAALLLVLAMLFHKIFVLLLSASVLLAFASLPSIPKRKLEGSLQLVPEFSTFSAIIMGAAFGPFVGAAFGLIVVTVTLMIDRGFNVGTPIALLIGAANGLFARFLAENFGIVWAGMIILFAGSIIGNAFMMILQKDSEITAMAVIGSLLNLSINYLLFAYMGRPILSLLI